MQTPSNDLWQLPDRLRTLVENELADREKILWLGRPIPQRFAWKAMPLVLFAIPWTAFALFWMAGAAGFKVPNFQRGFDLFPLFGIPFILVGVGMLSAPLWMMRKARKTVYVLTTERAIVIESGLAASIRSFAPDRLTDLRRKQRSDGSGDISFERKLTSDGPQATDYGFLGIADVKAVEEQIRQMVKTAGRNGT